MSCQTRRLIIERDADCGGLYQSKRRELLKLVRSLSSEQLCAPVPATAAWSVRDVVSHLVGIAADLNAGRFGPNDGDAWTANQVATRQASSIEDLADEWELEALQFEEGLRLLGYGIGSHYLGDLLQHASDIRSTIHAERIADDLGLAVALDFYLDSLHESLTVAGSGSVVMEVEGEEFVLGPGNPHARLVADRFEVFRCLGGRRSEGQIRALHWQGDVDRFVPLLGRYPLPHTDIVDE